MKGFPDLPPIWLAAALGVSWILATYAPMLRFDVGLLANVVFWAGLAVIAWAVWWFFRRKTPVEPHHTPKVLLVEGPFRFSRNPIYVGLTMILIGVTAGWGAISGLFTIPAFILIIHSRFVLKEEDALRETFGAEADDYIARTRRWV
ncbi:methyltransferase family protein [Pontivivens insulae]|uniref:Steroid 5-alpha reductase C-terminal domain-containing protein n=1 Tax=Pontivivens insulae TaxID=1639689 RepID=A0A2R8AD89_9RHOB|nr:isoprenylcysteine carboxylmethyltransferase family protein [Pontivivens insulae]RED13944.1 protein-S-isoprenylcysteine O-methyltransferase Ste14 [Pontivivens insulae]SPF30018.1 hypothetical protein POI8812_02346 [Pontivivens insulae]